MKYTKLERNWVMYDVGNSALVLLNTSVVPIYFNAINTGASSADLVVAWGNAQTIASLVIAMLMPILGALADYAGNKIKFFLGFFLTGLVLCLAQAIPMSAMAFLTVYVLCTIGLNSSMTFYDAMLPDITTDERMDAVSSSGYAWGYIGSTVPFIICLALIMGGPALGVPTMLATRLSFVITGAWWLIFTLPLIRTYKQKYGRERGPEDTIGHIVGGVFSEVGHTMLATRLSFVITGAWWLIFTLPLIRTYKQKYGRERGPEDTIGHIVGGVFSEVGHTMREIAHNKTVLVYMIAFFFYIDGVHTVISMATSYGSALGIDSTQLVLALLVTQFVAFPSAIIYGRLAGRVGTLNMILVAVAAYMGIVLFAAFFLKTAFEFWVLAILVGLFQGGVQALSRSYFGRIIPKEKSNEYYGFFDIFGRYASVMGTFLVSVVTSLTGNPSLGVLSIGVLLVVGFMLLVRLSRMTQAAQ